MGLFIFIILTSWVLVTFFFLPCLDDIIISITITIITTTIIIIIIYWVPVISENMLERL